MATSSGELSVVSGAASCSEVGSVSALLEALLLLEVHAPPQILVEDGVQLLRARHSHELPRVLETDLFDEFEQAGRHQLANRRRERRRVEQAREQSARGRNTVAGEARHGCLQCAQPGSGRAPWTAIVFGARSLYLFGQARRRLHSIARRSGRSTPSENTAGVPRGASTVTIWPPS